MLSSANTSYLQALNVIIVTIYVFIIKITTKLAHGLYHDVTVVDYNLNVKFVIIGM